MSYADMIKEKLNAAINKVAAIKEHFVKEPAKDFTRKRSLGFETMFKILLSMRGNSLNKELLEYFGYNENVVTPSAFIQQRDKILSKAFAFVMNEFTCELDPKRTSHGFRLFAVDGSNFNIAYNPNDPDTYFQKNADTRGYNQIHLNAMYDLCSKLYLDAVIQPGKQKNEVSALADMVDRSNVSGNVIVIADRGYECYNLFAHIEQKGWKYLIRVKDIGSTGIASALAGIPTSGEFDESVHIILTKKHTMEVRANRALYKFISSTATFDFLDSDKNLFYPMILRVVRLKLKDGSYETIITNLDRFHFPPHKLKELYHLRWGIETSFRELKYAIGLINLHSKTVERVTQEIYARLTMYNFCELITMNTVIKQKDTTKHVYQVNFTIAIQICIHFFSCMDNTPPSVPEALIKRYILPVRPDRSDPRKVRPKSMVSFIYRIA
jgi:hypothetical protein